MLIFTSLAEAVSTPSRIAIVDDSQRVSIAGSVSPRAAVARDLGATASDRQLNMSLRFGRTAAQQAALTKLLAAQLDPSSPQYRQWLTPEQFNAQFGLAAADLARISVWLESQGFTVTETGRGGQFVRFTGSVAQANQAFRTQIERVYKNGVEHFANLTAPSLPSSIAAVTTAITGLHDFRLRPRSLAPRYTTSSGTHYLTPQDLYTIYGVSNLLSNSIDGTNVKIAVVGQADVQIADVIAFRAAAGLSTNTPTVDLYGADPGSSSTADVVESELNLEYAGALAPSAAILFVTSTDVMDGSMTEAIDNNLAAVISNSYGDCEAAVGTTDLAYYNDLMQQGAAEGISIVSASGDAGATDCDYSVSGATNGLAVDFPASSPWVTGVGGTMFVEGSGSYWGSANSTGGGSAISYIPETAWNDYTGSAAYSTGGGASLAFPKPSWQTGTGVPADASRDVPDVAFSASAIHDPYVICSLGSCTSGFGNSSGGIQVIGGTSVASPVFAGIMALVVQKQGGSVGVANPTLYSLFNSLYTTSVFNDIFTGNNDSPCTAGSTGCPTGGAIGFHATAGYDQTTGLGSVNAYNLVNDWSLVTPLAVSPVGVADTITNLTASAASVSAGSSVTLAATVISNASTAAASPTGSVTFTVDSVTVGTAALSSAGVATYTLSTTSLTAGSHVLQATYGGDATYYGSKGAFTLTVANSTSTAPSFTLSPETVALGIGAGSITQGIVYTVTPSNGFTGTVNFDAIYSSNANITKIFSSTSVTITGTGSATTTLALAAYTGGNLSAIKNSFGWTEAGSGIVFAGLLAFFVPTRRRRVAGIFVVLLSFTTLIALVGCASNSASATASATQTNAASGAYPITITASSNVNGTVVTKTADITLTVQ